MEVVLRWPPHRVLGFDYVNDPSKTALNHVENEKCNATFLLRDMGVNTGHDVKFHGVMGPGLAVTCWISGHNVPYVNHSDVSHRPVPRKKYQVQYQ